MLSNSFHSSAKAHSLSSAGSLAKAERHNDRGYFSFSYDQSKIAQIVGNSSTLAADVERAINDTFNPYVDEYNARQKRKDRKIETSAFEYFCNQKKLDIATEAIFQIGDQEFWSRWRTDTVVQHGKRQRVLKSFPEEVKNVMNDILGKQVAAFEKIYETHGAQIAAAIRKAYDDAFAVAQRYEQQHPDFQDIYKIPSKDRVASIRNLPSDMQVAYAEYAQARDTMASIFKLNLLERSENGQMHIKVITGTGHYDEYSPHVHAISLCWADGYKNGLSSRVAKSVVLNKWALEIIQERLNEIAQEEISKHPEIFGDEIIKPKERGRNHDYTTEQVTRQNLAKLGENIEAAKVAEREAKARELDARQEASEASQEAIRASRELLATQERLRVAREQEIALRNECNALQWEIAETEQELQDMSERVKLIQDFEEYVEKADEIEEQVSVIDRILNRIREAHRIFKQKEADEFVKDIKKMLEGVFGWIQAQFGLVKEFEIFTKMPEEQRKSPKLEDTIKNAAARVADNARNSGDRGGQGR